MVRPIPEARPHSLVLEAHSGGGIWGKSRVEQLEPTPIEVFLAQVPADFNPEPSPIDIILKEAALG